MSLLMECLSSSLNDSYLFELLGDTSMTLRAKSSSSSLKIIRFLELIKDGLSLSSECE